MPEELGGGVLERKGVEAMFAKIWSINLFQFLCGLVPNAVLQCAAGRRRWGSMPDCLMRRAMRSSCRVVRFPR